ncbi:MAG: phage holin family protein [Clostridiales bacterium]|nr:phage holin family protein [Clostridiales bacterium]
MDKTIDNFKAAALAVFGLLTGLWGWLGWLVVGWICCMALDYLTGSLAAAKEGDWSSGKAREGIWHKGGMIVVVMVAAGADMLISLVLANLPVLDLPIQYPGLVCPVVLVWYIVTELGSMAENAATMGAPVPQWLVKLLAMSKNAVDSAGDKLSGDGDEQ